MDTARVDIAYRPLRIAWTIHSGDLDSLRRAVRLSHTLWGGRFNPIVLADRPDEARQIVEVFRADLILPVGNSQEVKDLPGKFPHLIDPLMGLLFLRHQNEPGRAHVLDVHNLLVHHRRDTPKGEAWEEPGIRRFLWDNDDPLADVFLVQFGAYPDADDIGIDYLDILVSATRAVDQRFDKGQPIPLVEHPSIGSLTTFGLRQHHTIRAGLSYPGFFLGDASNTTDLADFWNLRAANIGLLFVDSSQIARYVGLIPEYANMVRANLSHRPDHEQKVSVWARDARIDEAIQLLGEEKPIVCGIGDGTWNGLNVRPPMMVLGQESSLGVFGRDGERPRVSFAFKDKPFSGDTWFYTQHLVASVSLIGGLYGDDHYAFHPPYVPELNEFFARSMHLQYNKLRVEPERIGLVIDATEHDSYLNALPVGELVESVFDLAGSSAKLSAGGLITRQLISRLGGIRNTRVFKIPGVRRLLKTHGPTASFTKTAALDLIGSTDPNNPGARFSDHEDLYIEPREFGSKLTPQMVFGHLVANRLFRIGAELTCPTCRLVSWIALDSLKQRVTCELCGSEYDATRQLVDGKFHYRRTGVLGLEKNTQGAVPVTLVLEQLTRNLSRALHNGVYAPSYDLKPKVGVDLPVCEVDFVMILPKTYPDKALLILGETKDGTSINADDIRNLERIADAIPKHRFDTYIALTKLVPFTAEEIELAKSLNSPYRRRVIMLTARELEPYHLYERTAKELGITSYGGTAEGLAETTHRIYFSGPATPPQKGEKTNFR